MEALYRLIIYLHVSSSIVSIGPFFLLIPVLKKLRQAKDAELSAYLHTFQLVVRLTKHAGHVLIISGILLIWLGPWTWKTPWIIMTLVVMFSSIFFLARAFTPKLRRFHEKDADKEELVKQLTRSLWMYIILLMIMLWFMVVKPTF
ncbi:DUF2269 family protein [Niallia endozanthoxylica]|uniref:DUF2269 family protein n=1 Tax=Niallia endozanthoxylica TaxID=2036016 RepID=A0A5J5H755_9BACI|nr:DUF2269 family protein [Niallia endozanthoxylica]KAA9016469.1 DUF2269 family protein [Niallia endozanthoxylica]